MIGCMETLSRSLIKKAMAQIGAKGGKRSLVTMTPEERVARAKKASLAAAKVRSQRKTVATKGKSK